MVAPDAGTTRDAIDSLLRYNGKTSTSLTPRLTTPRKVEDDLEFYATLRTERPSSGPRSACWWWTPTLGLHNQDLRIATQAWIRAAP